MTETAEMPAETQASRTQSVRVVEAPSIEEALAAMPEPGPGAGRPPGRVGKFKDQIQELFRSGKSRGEIVKELNEQHRHDENFQALEYRDVYNYTKDENSKGSRGPTPRVVIKTSDGREVPRNEYIRELARGGMTRTQISKLLGIPYQYVHNALGKNNSKIDGAGAPVQVRGNNDGTNGGHGSGADAFGNADAAEVQVDASALQGVTESEDVESFFPESGQNRRHSRRGQRSESSDESGDEESE